MKNGQLKGKKDNKKGVSEDRRYTDVAKERERKRGRAMQAPSTEGELRMVP